MAEHLVKTKWQQAVGDLITAGLTALLEKNEKEWSGPWLLSSSTVNAILKLALKLSGAQESLKAAFAETFPAFAAQWPSSFADELLQKTMPGLQEMFVKFDIETLSRSFLIESTAGIRCMVPPKVNKDKKENQRRNKRKNTSQNKEQEEEKPQSDVVGDILKDFMKEARPILVATYGMGKSPGTSTDDMEEKVGRMTI